MRFITVAISILLASGCSPTTFGPAPGSPVSAGEAVHEHHDDDHDGDHDHDHDAPFDPVAAARVRVLQGDTKMPCGATEVLGTVDVHEHMNNEEQALGVLRGRAAALGAEAVIGVEFHHGEGHAEATHLSGMAVRCNDLIRGRSYDVIGSIDVPGAMGHEEEAFAAMRTRGRDMHADLIIDTNFEHGEGAGQPSHMTGKAIRFRGEDHATR